MPISKPWRIAYINSTIPSHLHQMCDGSHPQLPCNGLDAIYSQGYTPAVCHAIMKSVKEGQSRVCHVSARIVNVCIAATFEAQRNTAISVAALATCTVAPLLAFEPSRMASRRGPSQAREDEQIMRARQAAARAELQGRVDRNRA